jgi:hypothetical protein
VVAVALVDYRFEGHQRLMVVASYGHDCRRINEQKSKFCLIVRMIGEYLLFLFHI